MKNLILSSAILISSLTIGLVSNATTYQAPAVKQQEQVKPQKAASYPGGEKAMYEFIAKNVIYPVSAQENGIEGNVVVEFTVAADGTLSEFKIVKMIDPDLEEAAIVVIKKMPKWIPAQLDGKPVASKTQATVSFRLK